MATFPAKTNYAAGNVLTAAQMVDIGEQINALNGTVGKNKILNSDFRINQRNFSSETASAVYIFDRWRTGTVGGTSTFSAQTFTTGSAPVAGYEGRNFLRLASTGQSAAGDLTQVVQRIESVRTFAGQTVTVSFWAKASSGTPSIAVDWLQYFGTGGTPSSAVSTSGQKATLSTSWARYSFTFPISSISGKTIGTDNNDSLWLRVWTSAGTTYNTETNSLGIQTATIDVWGFQMESGNTATAFQTATGTLAGELQAAQRYYEKSFDQATAPANGANATTLATNVGQHFVYTAGATGNESATIPFKVTKRGTPTVTFFGNSTGNWLVAGNNAFMQSRDINQNGFNLYQTFGGGYTAAWGHWTASAEL